MKFYFRLQYRRFHRHLKDTGFDPLIGWLLIMVGFIGVSKFAFEQEYGVYIYSFLAINLTFLFSSKDRNEFLKQYFPKRNFLIIRGVENVMVILPFVTFMFYKQFFIEGISTLLIGIFFSLARVNFKKSIVIPTPFYKHPFEFTVGFRNTYFIFPICYTLTGIAIAVGNFNLGVFAIIVSFLVCISYYSKPEPQSYVWMQKGTPQVFLNTKLWIATKYSLAIVIPIAVFLMIGYPNDILIILGLLVLGVLYLAMGVLGKYAFYPSQVNLPQGILFFIALWFPLILIILLPYTYAKSVKNLNPIME